MQDTNTNNDQVDPFDALEERMANPPKLWTPKGALSGKDADECIVEPSVRGIVEDIETRTGDYGDYLAITLVQRDRTRVLVLGFGTVLSGKLRAVRLGDAVGATYLGTKATTTPGMQPYDDYDVVIMRAGETVSPAEVPDDRPDWGAPTEEVS